MKIVKLLNGQDVPTPGRYLASIGAICSQYLKGSGHWQTWTVNTILADEAYIGNMVQGKTRMVGRKQVQVSPDEWVRVCGTHEPLIDRDLFEKAQAALEQAKRAHRELAEKVPYSDNILRGRIFCGCCGRPMNRRRENHSNRYSFSCIANNRIGQNACASGAYITENSLFESIVTIIRQEAETVIGNSLRLKQQNRKIALQKAAVEKEISALQKETEKNKAFSAALYENFVKGVLTQAEYHEMKAGYSQKILDAADRVRQLQQRQRAVEQQAAEYSSLADRLAAVDRDTELTALLVDQLIERVIVNRPHDVTVKFRFENCFQSLTEVLEDE